MIKRANKIYRVNMVNYFVITDTLVSTVFWKRIQMEEKYNRDKDQHMCLAFHWPIITVQLHYKMKYLEFQIGHDIFLTNCRNYGTHEVKAAKKIPSSALVDDTGEWSVSICI